MNNPTRAMICVATLVAPPLGAAQDTRTELQSHPGCHVDGLTFEGDVDVAWTGTCSGEWANGPGVLMVAEPDGVTAYEGELADGKLHGHALIRLDNGTVAEGPYAAGAQTGQWVFRYPDGRVFEGLAMNSQRTGRWAMRHPDGTVIETPFVGGQRHGTEVEQWPATAQC